MRGLVFVLALAVTGCVSQQGEQQVNQSFAAMDRPAVEESSPLYQAVRIGAVTGGRTGSVSPSGVMRADQFEGYLRAVLSGRSMLATGDAARYTLNARIARSSYPTLAMSSVEVTAEVAYQLVDNATGSVVLETTVTTSATTGFGASPVFATRLGLSAAQSAGANATEISDRLVGEAQSGRLASR